MDKMDLLHQILIELDQVIEHENHARRKDNGLALSKAEITLLGQMSCKRIDPLFALCSKAIKAREKNRILIAQALKVYGKSLVRLIEKYGGDLEYFK